MRIVYRPFSGCNGWSTAGTGGVADVSTCSVAAVFTRHVSHHVDAGTRCSDITAGGTAGVAAAGNGGIAAAGNGGITATHAAVITASRHCK